MAAAGPDTGTGSAAAQVEPVFARAERAWQDARATWGRAQATWATIAANEATAARGSSKELLTVSPLARLRAQLATMPVIEQAKGILMAQRGCGPDGAFDLLRQASQRSNVPVRELAARIVHSAHNHRRPAATDSSG